MKRIFGVDVTFLAAGDVFRTGLLHAAQQLDIEYQSDVWHGVEHNRPNPELARKIAAFNPDLILVIHGRAYAGHWLGQFDRYKQALWLTDEPYEVDDAAEYSKRFDFVFSNDLNTLHRHRDCHYLPTCYDPVMHFDAERERIYRSGFIGGHNRIRENMLVDAARADLLDYVIGGPWRGIHPIELWKAKQIPPNETAAYYQQSKVVINIWREEHHYNKTERIPGYSMNPRIYEALACGALVVSEYRPEIPEVFPDLPTFDKPHRLVCQLDRVLSDDALRLDLLAKCRARLTGHTYADRLRKVIDVCFSS